MLVWLDAHLSPALAGWLSTSFDVEARSLRSLGLREAEDSAIFARARDAGAILVTKDADFVLLLQRHGPPPQVVWLTCGNTSNSAVRVLLADAWPDLVRLLSAGEPLVEIGGRAI